MITLSMLWVIWFTEISACFMRVLDEARAFVFTKLSLLGGI
jgi:hypothetical protein